VAVAGTAAPKRAALPGTAVDVDADSSEVVVRERGAQRKFQFDRVFDVSTPVGTSLSDVDALVRVAPLPSLSPWHYCLYAGVLVSERSNHVCDFGVFARSCATQVPFVIEGENVCIFSSTTPDLAVETANAIHARVLRTLFNAVALDGSGLSTSTCRVTLSYVDVCMEHLFDMLAVAAGGSDSDGVSSGLTIVEPRKLDEAALVARTGVRRRYDGALARGDNLCRSHGILTVCVTLIDGVSGRDVTGKLHVVELAAGVRASA
jgi:hypothetical protein